MEQYKAVKLTTTLTDKSVYLYLSNEKLQTHDLTHTKLNEYEARNRRRQEVIEVVSVKSNMCAA